MEFGEILGRKIVWRPSISLMYEMYPDVWAVASDRQPASTGPRPRRRARKEHSVVPAILVHAGPKTTEAVPGR